MSTSGSINFNGTKDEMIQDALREIGYIGEDESPTADAMAISTRIFNRMIKAWQGRGVRIWARTQAIIFLNLEQQSYELVSTGDHSCLASDFVHTTLSAAAAAAATTLTVASTSGMLAGDYIGIELDDDTRHWTTISSITNSTTLVIASGLADTASDDATVYSYTTRLNRPMQILDCRRVDINGLEKPMFTKSYDQYMKIVTKAAVGDPSIYHYTPELSDGTLYIWTTVDTCSKYLKATVQRQLEDMDNANDNPDFPSEWQEALVLNLAVRLRRVFSLGADPELLQAADAAYKNIMYFDDELDTINFMPGNNN